jgi:hypothetical protein
LIQREEVASVTLLVRKPTKVAGNSPKIIEKVIDYNALNDADFAGFDIAFCCLGPYPFRLCAVFCCCYAQIDLEPRAFD